MFRTLDAAPRRLSGPSAAFTEPLERRTFLSGDIAGIVRHYAIPPGPGLPEGWLDFGTALHGSISGTVYDDRDRDGMRDPGEPPAAGQTVFIDYDNDGVDRDGDPTTTTDATGTYRFDRLFPSAYRVRLLAAPGWRRAGSIDFHHAVVQSGESLTSVNFAVARDLAVAGVTLIDSSTDRPIAPLSHGDTIDLTQVGRRLNVRADFAAGLPRGTVRSVRFNLDGRANYRIENAAPYALGGDTAGDYHTWTPRLGTHTLVVTAYSGPGATGVAGLPLMLSFNVVDSRPIGPALRVNAGGRSYTTAAGDLFAADTGFRGALSRSTEFEVAGTDNDALYSSRRYGRRMLFSKPVANGQYTLRLHFAEPTFESAGRRVFDVFAEGRRVLDDYDLVADAGPRTAIVKSFPVTVGDRRIDLAFIASHDSAIVSAIELVPLPPGPAAPGPVLVDAGAASGVTDSVGRAFEPDRGFTGGTTSTEVFDVDGDGVLDADDALLSTHRSGARFSFRRPVANGNYSVLLGFAEPDPVAVSESRKFDVFAEGRRVLDDYDIAKDAGGARRATAQAFDVLIEDGVLDLSFAGNVGDALVSSIVVLPTDIPAEALPYSMDCATDAQREFRSAFNLSQIGQAIQLYAGENRGRFPPDLEALVRYLDSHVPFTDPRAGTHLPRGQLSPIEQQAWAASRNDYLYIPGRRWTDSQNTPLAYENPRRVDGDLLVVFVDGHVEKLRRHAAAELIGFDPAPPDDPPVFHDPSDPECRPDPAVVASISNLLAIGRAAQMHANENRGNLPNDFGRLFETQDVPLDRFRNPRGDTPQPSADLTYEQQVGWAAGTNDYLYFGYGTNYATPAEIAIAYENPSEMEGGINLLFADGRVEFREVRWAVEAIRASVAWDGRRR